MAIFKRSIDEEMKGMLGLYSDPDDVLQAMSVLKQENFSIHSVLSPVPHHEIAAALQLKPSPVRYFTFFGGVIGGLSLLALAIYAHLRWNFITGGKPVIAWIPFVVIAFEGCILLGVISTLLGMMIKNRMPRLGLPTYYDPRFTEDRFGLLVSCQEEDEEKVSRLLNESGAEEIRQVPSENKVPKVN